MLKFYNSLTNKLDIFKSKEENVVNIYFCGPTVYNDIHIGNARPLVFYDALARYFILLGYKVNLVSNITDLDDKIVLKAKELGIKESELTKTYTKAYNEVASQLNVLSYFKQPKATDYIVKMEEFISSLIDRGYAYIEKSGIYFRVDKIKDYGLLSNRKKEELYEGVRKAIESDKEYAKDFALWKFCEDGITFDTKWGKGRPGWHTECVVMNYAIFGESLDIHGGGVDLIFPHHENELCQFEALTGSLMAPYWIHTGHINLNGNKMAKSTGNMLLAKDLFLTVNPNVYRLLVLSHSFNAPINYSSSLLDQFSLMYDKISLSLNKSKFILFVNDIKESELDKAIIDEYISLVDNNLNFSNGISYVYSLFKQLNVIKENVALSKLVNTLDYLLNSLGVTYKINFEREDKQIYLSYLEARKNNDYQQSDILRNKLVSKKLI